MRTLVLASLFVCGSAFAADNHCDVNLDGEFQIKNKVISVNIEDKTQIEIDAQYNLSVDGKSISLNSYQQALVEDYYDGIHQAIPQAADIANEAVSLANTAINEVFAELLGSDSHTFEKLSIKLQELDEQVQRSFYAHDGSLRVDSRTFNDGDFFGEQWGNEFEQVIEEVISESLGSVMVNLGTQILFSGGDMEAFEQRMERFGEQLEETIEFQAQRIEHKAEDLCKTLQHIERTESRLQAKIQQLSHLDILQLDTPRNAM